MGSSDRLESICQASLRVVLHPFLHLCLCELGTKHYPLTHCFIKGQVLLKRNFCVTIRHLLTLLLFEILHLLHGFNDLGILRLFVLHGNRLSTCAWSISNHAWRPLCRDGHRLTVVCLLADTLCIECRHGSPHNIVHAP